MKKITTYIALACMAFALLPSLHAQTPIKLKFNHKLGAMNYKKSVQSSNNINHLFNITRLEYYISNIIVIHDGGTRDTIKNTYLLMNPTDSTSTHNLASITLTNIEAIQFSIGVDGATNHLNPTIYPAMHPLAPKSPSMHWGWTAGYRFIAIEGKSGSSLNQKYELHGLGDFNYFSLKIPVTAIDDNGSKIIELNANYSNILRDIDLNSGVIHHGIDLSDRKALLNMRDHVFTNTSGQGDILSLNVVEKPAVINYPNPGETGTMIKLECTSTQPVYYKVFDLEGKCIHTTELNENEIQFTSQGVYNIQAFTQDNQLLSTTKQVIL